MVSEIKFLTSSDDFLEWFILFENEDKGKIFFDKNKIDKFSLSELGYKMSDFFDFEDFAMLKQRQKPDDPETEYLDDYKLFDIAEITILFSLDNKRSAVIDRFNSIFIEEDTDFQIIEHLITRKSGDSIKTLLNLLKDENLKKKLKMFFESYDNYDFINSAKTSADILNIIFSDYIKNEKSKKISELCNKLADKIVVSDTKGDKRKRFLEYMNDLLKLSKNLSNDIYDVRHTEKSTIILSNENIYKLISNQNISLVELVLTTLKDDYVLGDNWEKIKDDYITKYNINKLSRQVIKKRVIPTILKSNVDDEIDPDDIPF